jgi:glucan biosynthesis protein C
LPAARYLADASYWIYLVHLPIVITLAGLLAHTTLPVFVKFIVVFGGTTASCIASYRLFVRSTPIGWLLNGRRRQ